MSPAIIRNKVKHREKADRCDGDDGDGDDGDCTKKLSQEENVIEMLHSFGSRSQIKTSSKLSDWSVHLTTVSM